MPNNWKTYKLEEISTNIAYGYTASASIENVGPKFLRITDIQDNFIDWKSVPFCKIKENDFIKNKLEIGDIVVARTGNSTGATACIKDEIDAVFASYLIRFRIDKEIANPFYIDFILRSQNWKNYVEAVKGGSAQPGANAKQFGAFKLELPPLQEQKSIAAILSAIDDKIENNLAINKTLEEMAMALYKHWFVDFGPFQEGEFVESELGSIPKGWEVKRLDELGKISYGAMPKKEKLNISGFPVFSGYKYVGFYPEYNCLENKVIVVARGVGGTGDIKFTSEKCFLTNLSICIHNDLNVIQDILLYYFLNLKGLHFLRTGSAQPQITINDLNKIFVVVPSKSIQFQFMSFFNDLINKKESNLKENQTLTQLRDSLLPKLISGEVRLKEFRESITN